MTVRPVVPALLAPNIGHCEISARRAFELIPLDSIAVENTKKAKGDELDPKSQTESRTGGIESGRK
jgi:hypothetical protein